MILGKQRWVIGTGTNVKNLKDQWMSARANAILDYIGTHGIGDERQPKIMDELIIKNDTNSTWDNNLVRNLWESVTTERAESFTWR